MFIHPFKKLNKRGFTLAETIIALAVISVSSGGLLSLVLSSQRATVNAAHKQQAQLYAVDIVNCYRVDGNFTENVAFALGVESISHIEKFDIKNGFRAETKIKNNTLTVTIFKGEKELSSLSFTKGVPAK